MTSFETSFDDCSFSIPVIVSAKANSYLQDKAKMQAHGARTMPIILGTNGTVHEESRKHLECLGVGIPGFVACAIFVIEYQHHKATADYMTKISSCLKGKTAAAPDGRALS